MKEILRKNIQMLRKEKKLTQEGLASILYTTRNAIASYENGNTMPPVEVLFSLAVFFDVSIDFLLGRTKTRHLRTSAFSKEESALLDMYAKLSPEDQEMLFETVTAQFKVASQRYEREKANTRPPAEM